MPYNKNDNLKPRRSVLYMPGSNERVLQKVSDLGADSYIFDIEDAVAPDAKKAARNNIHHALNNYNFKNREIIVRVNGIGTEWIHDDIKMACEAGPDAILLPKVEDAKTIETIENLIQGFYAPKNMQIWAMIETPLGVLNSLEIAKSSERLSCLVMGTSDLVNDLNARHTPDRAPLYYSFGQCVLSARTAGISIIDGVHLDLNDEEGYLNSCIQGRDFGFDGKSLIHPKQILDANNIFGPSEKEIEEAKQIIAAFDKATKQGKGVTLLNGKLVENLHVENAKRILHMADLIKNR